MVRKPYLVAALLLTTQLSGCLFIFVPGSVVGAATDAVTGSTGENCVATTARVGDKVPGPGNVYYEVKSLSGASVRCQDPYLPIRAELVATGEKAPPVAALPQDPRLAAIQINLPDGWQIRPQTPEQADSGERLRATNEAMQSTLIATVFSRTEIQDMKTYADSQRVRQKNAMQGGLADVVTQTRYNGIDVYRCTITGRQGNENLAKIMTIMVSDRDAVQLLTIIKLGNLERNRQSIESLVATVSGMS